MTLVKLDKEILELTPENNLEAEIEQDNVMTKKN